MGGSLPQAGEAVVRGAVPVVSAAPVCWAAEHVFKAV